MKCPRQLALYPVRSNSTSVQPVLEEFHFKDEKEYEGKGREGRGYIRNSLCPQWQGEDFNVDIYVFLVKNYLTPHSVEHNSWSN